MPKYGRAKLHQIQYKGLYLVHYKHSERYLLCILSIIVGRKEMAMSVRDYKGIDDVTILSCATYHRAPSYGGVRTRVEG